MKVGSSTIIRLNFEENTKFPLLTRVFLPPLHRAGTFPCCPGGTVCLYLSKVLLQLPTTLCKLHACTHNTHFYSYTLSLMLGCNWEPLACDELLKIHVD